MNNKTKELETIIYNLRRQLAEEQKRLAQITNSRTWRLAKKVRKILPK